ncbi:MAG: type II secretion system protein [Burkholderiales bacterium]
MKNRQQAGFTLIELVLVIVILGILAAVAVPRFIDVKSDAAKAATKGVAASLQAAAAMNKAERLIKGSSTSYNATECAAYTAKLDAFPSGYTVTGTLTTGTNFPSGSCTVAGPESETATFVGYGISG